MDTKVNIINLASDVNRYRILVYFSHHSPCHIKDIKIDKLKYGAVRKHVEALIEANLIYKEFGQFGMTKLGTLVLNKIRDLVKEMYLLTDFER